MNNIYKESKGFYDLIVSNQEEDNFLKVERFENMLEESAVLVFAFQNDRDIFKYMRIPKCGRLAVNKISEAITMVLANNKSQRLKLLNLYDIANQVHEQTSHFPSVKSIIKTEEDEKEYIKALSYYVARHILVHKYRIGKIYNNDTKSIVSDYLEIRNASSGMYIGMHQISNKLVEGNLNPKETLSKLEALVRERKFDLARRSIAYNGGYLAQQSKFLQLNETNNEILMFSFRRKEKKKDNDTLA